MLRKIWCYRLMLAMPVTVKRCDEDVEGHEEGQRVQPIRRQEYDELIEFILKYVNGWLGKKQLLIGMRGFN